MNNFGCNSGLGNCHWIINLIIIIVAVEFLTQIFCGSNSCDNNCNTCNC